MELMLAALVLLVLYLLENGRMNQVGAWIQDFVEYLERQQGQG